jgi:putative peptidoglycan lipid II flippase
MTKSLYHKVGIASLILMASVFLSRVIGLFREMAIAYAGGARGDVDAYQIAFVIPEILNHIVASGFLSVTFIPIFSGYLAADREAEGWEVFSVIMNSFGLMLIGFIGIAMVFAPELIALTAPGIHDPMLLAKAVRMTRIILPAQFFFFTGGMFTAAQFAKESFSLPALAPLVYNICIIAGGMALGPVLKMEGFSWGVLAGSFLGNFAIQYRGARKVGMRYASVINFTHPDFLAYVRLTLPLMVGLTMSFSTEFFLKFFGSYLPEGNIACLNYGLRVMFILVGLLGQAIGTASFPYMARLAAENRIPEMNQLLDSTLKFLSLIIPFSMLLIILRHEVVAVLFERGQFDRFATNQTAGVLLYLMIGAFAFAAQTVVVRGYYAIRNTLFPAIYSTVGVMLSIPFYILGMKLMGAGGVALAISISAVLQVVLLYTLWNRRSNNTSGQDVYKGYAKMILLSIPIGMALEFLRKVLSQWIPDRGLIGNLLICFITGLSFLILLFISGYLFNIREITGTFRRLIQKAI